MSYSYYVFGHKVDDKFYYYAEKVANNNNLLSVFTRQNVVVVRACKTFKEAKDVAAYWIECAKKNGNYYFSA